MMNRLKGAIAYLSGPIDYASDHGKGWREDFKNHPLVHKMGIVSIDPCDKPLPIEKSIEDEKLTTDHFRKTQDWEGMRKHVKIFRRQDLRFTDIADFLVVFIDPKIHLCGTYDELFTAERQKKPLFCIIPDGIAKLPSWLFAVFKIENIFTSVDECVNRLYSLSESESDLDSNWVLVRKHLDDYNHE